MKPCILLLLTLAVVLPAQQRAFEVASIRLHNGPVTKVDISISGSRVTVFAYSFADLIGEAYDLKDYQLSGASGWMKTNVYDIAAKAEGEAEPTMSGMRPMLRALLADRFNLKIHSGMRELPVYALVIAKGGPKLTENVKDTPGAKFDGDGRDTVMTFTAAPIEWLTRQLPRIPGVDRPVLDKTGLTGHYDFRLSLADYRMTLNPEKQAFSGPSPDAASNFTVLQEQLGLRLEPSKGQVEVFVVDHAEKPSEN